VDAVRFIANIISHAAVESTMKQLCLQPFEQRRSTRHINLLMTILGKNEQHPAVSSAFDDLLNKPTNSTIQTRSQTQWVLTVPTIWIFFSQWLSGS